MIVGALVVFTYLFLPLFGGYTYGLYVANRVDTIGLFCLTTSSQRDVTGTGFVSEMIGERNQNPIDVHVTWTMRFDFGGGVVLADTSTFTIPAHGHAYTFFTFSFNRNDASQMKQNSNPTFTSTRDYKVMIFSYHLESVINSTTESSGSSSSSNVPPCL